jgi:para-nitrobenzyl esterase
MRLSCLLLLLLPSMLHAQPQLGPWFDRSRDGHGIDVQRSGDTLFVVLYTFDATGEPEWFTAQGPVAEAGLEAELLRATNTGSSTMPQVQRRSIGQFSLRLGASAASVPCNDGTPRGTTLAVLEFSIDGERNTWCVEPLLPAAAGAERAMDGTWWGGSADDGWGLTTYFLPGAAARASAHLLYYYDATGAPRWSIASAPYDAFVIDTRWVSQRGYCRRCPAQPLQARDGGQLSLSLTTPLQAPGLDNRLSMDAVYAGPAGGRWARQIRLERISGLFLPPAAAATREGLIAGATDTAGTIAWRGIPFAAPPVGALRLRATQPAASRQRLLETRSFGPGCPQLPGSGFFAAGPPAQAEDCLTLNVWAPGDARPGDARPVMLWIHGGGHVQGGSSQQLNGRALYDGSQYARRGVVFVSINYRLGALGYGVFRELIGEFPDQPGAGNYGLLDQIAALRWVRDNIGGFGGDPANVTIFGESAGGVSVCALLASPLARGLIRRSIIQSGSCENVTPRLLVANGNDPAAAATGDRVKQRLGCTEIDARACLRASAVADMLAAAQGSTSFSGSGETYAEVLDGFALSESPGDALRSGSAAQVPLLIGINEDETTTLIPVAQRPQTADAYEALVRSRLPPTLAAAALQQYPAADFSPVWRAWTAINTDIAFICPSARAAREHAARGNPVYAYYFTQTLPGQTELGAYHAIEIPFLFSDMDGQPESIRALSTTMKSLWVSYARDGVPDSAGVPAWPLHPPSAQLGLEFRSPGLTPRAGYRDSFCNFWARYLRL